MKMWKTISVVVALLAIGVFGSLPLGSAQDGKSVEQMIAEAKTPADHEAIAAYYEKEAQEAQQKYAEHLKLKAAYAKIPHLASLLEVYRTVHYRKPSCFCEDRTNCPCCESSGTENGAALHT